jgi:hypothetical protein
MVMTMVANAIGWLRSSMPARRASPFGLHPGVVIHGDLLAPIDSAWAALE